MTSNEKTADLAAVARDRVYPLPLFQQITGLSAWALRSARRGGLKMKTVGRRKYVRGEDWLDYLANVKE
jgi:hypothetical protein